jgi:hypothetical protein
MATRRSLLASIFAVLGLWCASTTAASPPMGQAEAPAGPAMGEVDFERHVQSLFGRLGCNSAACHGSFKGKGGFRLGLFGQSPENDHASIHDGRVDLDSPDESLLLLKPSGREKHGGGLRFKEDSWEYSAIKRWIAAGARHNVGRGSVQAMEFHPASPPTLAAGEVVTLRVKARFSNGDYEDVTAYSELRSRDELVVEIRPDRKLVARLPGDTTIVASYRGQFAAAAVVVPFELKEKQKQPTSSNLIDDEISSHLARLGLVLSPPAGDTEFLRRATLDVCGTVPNPDDVRAFLVDPDPRKRFQKIDLLLAHPRRAALWATRMCDITACNVNSLGSPEELRPKWAKMWHDWFRRRFQENQPYDQMVRGILLATSRSGQPIETWIDQEVSLLQSAQSGFDASYAERPSLDLFWRRTGPEGNIPVEDLAELVASAFLGTRLHCARCHQHPYDSWTQADFAGYANIFARLEFGSSTELRTAMNQRLEMRRREREQGGEPAELPRLQEVFLAARNRPLVDAAPAAGALPKAPGGPLLKPSGDPREALLDWLTQADNPFFARSFVNRIWAKYFGAGLVEPVDDFSAANPPRLPRLLDRLAREFVESGYDVAHIERLILSSDAYQRSSLPAGNNNGDKHGLARALVRPLLAESLLDAINSALETVEEFGKDAPPGSQAIELAPNRFSDPRINELFRILGRSDRRSLCDCDRAAGPTIRQPIFLMSDPRIQEKIRGGRLARLLADNKSDEEIITEFYLATLSRLPDPAEREFALSHIASIAERSAGHMDLVWALINSREFLTNH